MIHESKSVHDILCHARRFLVCLFHVFWVILFYVLFGTMVQVFFHADAVTATCITGGLLALFCTGLHFDDIRNGFLVSSRHSRIADVCSIFYAGFLSVSMMVLFSWFYAYFPERGMEQRSYLFGNMSVFVYILYACVMAPVTEECIFRFFLYNRLKRLSGRYAALFLSSAAFAMVHGTLAHMVIAFLFGAMQVVIYEYTGRWYMAVVCHMLYNVLSIFVSVPLFMICNHIFIFILFVVVVLLIFVPFCIFDVILNKKSDL